MSDDPTKTRDPAPSPGENPPATDTPGRSHPLQGEDERIAEAWLAQSDPSPQLYTDLGEIDSIDRPSRSSRRRRLLIRAAVILVPMLLVGLLALAVQTWERGALPWERPEAVEVDWVDLNVEHRGVRVHGVIHLDAGFTLKQRRRTWTGGEEEFEAYLYPFFHPDGWNDREVRIMLYTTRPPEDASYAAEERVIEGFLRPLGPDRWDPVVQVSLEERGYKFALPVEETVLVIEEYVD